MAESFRPATEGAGRGILKKLEELYATLDAEKDGEEPTLEAVENDGDITQWLTEETALELVAALKALNEKIEDRKNIKLGVTLNGNYSYYNTYESREYTVYAPDTYGENKQVLVTDGTRNGIPQWSNSIGDVELKDGNVTLPGDIILDGEINKVKIEDDSNGDTVISTNDKTGVYDGKDGLYISPKGVEIGNGLLSLDENGILTTLALSARYGLDYLSWEQISEICKAGIAPTMFHVGQEKHCTITIDGSGNKYDVTFQILGFNHDDLATEDADYNNGCGKAAITWGLKNCLGYIESEETPSDANGWKGSLMRKTLAEIYDSYLEDEIKTVLRQVKKQSASSWSSSAGLNETEDYLFLFSHVEVFGTNNQTEDTREYVRSGTHSSLTPVTGFYWSGEPTKLSADGEGHQYEFYKGGTWVSPCLTYAVNSFGAVVSRLTTDDSGSQSYVYGYREHRYYQTKSYKAMYDTGSSAQSWMTRSASSGASTAFYVWVFNGGDAEGTQGTRTGLVFGMCT